MNKKTLNNVISISIPSMGEIILYNIISMFDIMFVGRHSGKIAISATGLSNEILLTFSSIFISLGICVAITSLIARNVGAYKLSCAEEYASMGFFIGVIISFFLAIIFFIYCNNILFFAGARGEVLTLGTKFMKVCSIGVFFSMLSSLLCSIRRGYGDTSTPFLIAAITIFVNLILDILLIFGFAGFPIMGVMGAAFAKTVAQITGFIFIFVYSITNSKIKIKLRYLFIFNMSRLKELIRFSLPCSFEEAAFSISRLVSNLIIMNVSSTAYAANQIANTVESISLMPGIGLGVAATTLVGLKVGENNSTEAKDYAKICIYIGVGIMLFCSLFFLLIPNYLISFFIKNSEIEVISLSSSCLRIGALEQPFLAISIIAAGAMKGAGNAKTPLYITIISSWLIRLPLMFYFIYILSSSVTYVWWITTFQWGFDAILTCALLRRNYKNASLL